MNLIAIHFDGGCKPTNPGNKYGSYEVLLNRVSIAKVGLLELGFGTNNEAEFDILLEALNWTTNQLWKGGFPLSAYDVKLFTDSTIVRNRINGTKRGKDKSEPSLRMGALAAKCRQILAGYKSFTAIWNGRDANVNRFGH